MRVLLSLLALATAALGHGHAGHDYYLVDKMCFENGTDPAGNDLSKEAGLKKHSTKCLSACMENGSDFVLVKGNDDDGWEVAYVVPNGDAAVRTLIADNNCKDNWMVNISGGDVTDADGDNEGSWTSETTEPGTITRKNPADNNGECAMKEGPYFVVDNMCWESGTDPSGNDLTTLEGIAAHSAECALMSPCQNSGYSLVSADSNGVVTKKYSIYNGECSDGQYTTYKDCTDNSETWTFSNEQKNLVQTLQHFKDGEMCTNHLKLMAYDIGWTENNGGVLRYAGLSFGDSEIWTPKGKCFMGCIDAEAHHNCSQYDNEPEAGGNKGAAGQQKNGDDMLMPKEPEKSAAAAAGFAGLLVGALLL